MSESSDHESVVEQWQKTLGVEAMDAFDARVTFKPEALAAESLSPVSEEGGRTDSPLEDSRRVVSPVGIRLAFVGTVPEAGVGASDLPVAPTILEPSGSAGDAWQPFAATMKEDEPAAASGAVNEGSSGSGCASVEATGIQRPVYEVVDELGRGGMGIVYRARQPSLPREVALKLALPGQSEDSLGRFRAEALVVGSFDHPNIVPVHEMVISGEGELAFAMKLVSGRSWQELLRSPEEGVQAQGLAHHLGILLSVCNAVDYAHSRHVTHNDLKPENVMVGTFGEVLVMDWGLAMDFSDPPRSDSVAPHRSTLPGPCGTPNYIAPELALGRGDGVGPWTDVFLLGAVLYELLTGKPPFVGANLREVLSKAVQAEIPAFPDGLSSTLQRICRKALSRLPADRYQSVGEFRDALEGYLDHRESLAISNSALQTLERCLAEPSAAAGSERLYADFALAVAGFRQAFMLWKGNEEARRGEDRAHVAFAEAALQQGDVGLAESEALSLTIEQPERAGLLDRVARARIERTRRARNERLARQGLALAVVVIVIGLAVGYALVSNQRRRAERNLDNVMRLADVQLVQAMTAQADELWPALPEKVPAMDEWLAHCQKLLDRLSGHRRYLEWLRADSGKKEGERWVFDDQGSQWKHDTFTDMVEAASLLESNTMADVRARRSFASTVQAASIEAYRRQWDEAMDAIADPVRSPAYGGLRIVPQIGLVPLGRDPDSGLWEFAHLQSGAIPERDADGRLVLDEAVGVVLVLLPGGRVTMGVRQPDADHPLGSPHVDSKARGSEGPVHELVLDPFFMGKFELTQAQWQRFSGGNPSAYLPGTGFGGQLVSGLNPVEQVRWREVSQLLARLDLQLSTEAQWEYSARAGTSSVYWTGDEHQSLQGALNIADHYCKTHEGPGSWSYEEWLDDGYTVHAPVGSYRANAFGLHDTAGNVWEWVEDRYTGYDRPVRAGDALREAPAESPRVFRGGGFRASRVHARSADRYSLYAHEFRAYDVGARAARRLDLP